MIERMTDMPAQTRGFRVTGGIKREDYDNVLGPELKQAVQEGGVRTLYLIEGLDQIEPSALWADAKLGFDVAVQHRKSWVRTAIVTDIDWMARATNLFAWMIPGEVRLFPVGDLEAAKAWVAG